MVQLAGKTLKGYELLEEIGSGGFGSVYRARQKSTFDREVAIKIIRPDHANEPEFIRRFETEAELVARLEHPHITPLIDYWRDPSGAYLVMRYLRGGSVQNGLENGAYSVETTFRILEQIASALDLAHRYDVIHRDIKPGNILLDEDGNAYLADFGIAKDLSRTHTSETSPDAIVGSLDYISPEQARGEEVTARTDIYSLGITLYEMLLGEHPFEGSSSLEKFYKHINDPLPDMVGLEPEFNDELNDIIQKATRKDPTQRYGNVLEIALTFRDALGQTQDAARELSLIEQLTMREHEILALIADGLTNRQVAEELFIQPSTVKWHIAQMYKKLGVHSRVQAIVRGRELNLIFSGDSSENMLSLNRDASTSSLALLPEPENPYKGLYAFQTHDARDFFGREKMLEQLIARMNDTGRFQRFLAIVGPSGSGKSSVMKAGLIPAIWKGGLPNSERWFVVEMLPGTRPLDELEIALTRVAANQSHNMREHLERDEFGLVRVAELILPQDKTELVLVIDQFEELFTLVEDEAHRRHFLNMLLATVIDNRSRVRIIITMRADYYDRPLHYPEFGEMLQARMETVLPLTAKGLEAAISEPAQRVGITFEAGLIAEIVSEMNYQAGALPLLQYALTELFEQREGRKLTSAAYHNIGGAVGALAKKADEIFVNFDENQQELTRQIFLRLVTLGEGAENTRRRTPFKELLSLNEEKDSIEEIIDVFANHRLLALDHDPGTRQPTVEVAHEAILREWEQLRKWLNDSRDDIRQERQLAQATALWETAKRDKSYLLTGGRLKGFEDWTKQTDMQLTPLEKIFLETSTAKRETLKEAELRQEQLVRKMLIGLVTVLTIGVIVSTGFGFFALTQRNEATTERDNAQQRAEESQSLVWAFQARANNPVNYPMALHLALESVQIDNPLPQTESIFREIVFDDGLQYHIIAHSHQIRSVAATHDGTLAVSASCANLSGDICQAGELAAWNLITGTEIWRIESHEGWVNAVVMMPDNQSFFAGGCGLGNDNGDCIRGDIIEYAVSTGEIIRSLEVHTDSVTAMTLHPNGTQVLIATADGILKLWDFEQESFIHILEGHEAAIYHVAFNIDGTMALSGDAAGMLSYWQMDEGISIWNINAHGNAITGVEIGDTFTITTGLDFAAYRWDLETGAELETVTFASIPCCLLPHPDQESIYIMVDEGASLRSLTNLALELDQFGATNSVYRNLENEDASGESSAATFIPNTSTMVLGDYSGSLQIWSLEAAKPINVLQGSSYVRNDITPDGTRMMLSTIGTTLEIWDIDPLSPTYLTQVSSIEESDLAGVGFATLNADGTQIAWGIGDIFFGTEESRLYLVDALNGEILQTFDASQHSNPLRAVTFIADDTRIVTGSQAVSLSGQDDLIVWNVSTGEMIVRYPLESDVTNISVVDNDRVLLSSAGGANIRLFNIATGEIERSYAASYATMTAWYSPISQQVYAGLGNGSAEVWNFESAELIDIFVLEDIEIMNSNISPDGRYALLGGTQAILLDIATGSVVNRFPQQDSAFAVTFSPDGQSVWTADLGGAIKQWSIVDRPLDDLIGWVYENRYIHEPTCVERETYRIDPLCDE